MHSIAHSMITCRSTPKQVSKTVNLCYPNTFYCVFYGEYYTYFIFKGGIPETEQATIMENLKTLL